MLNALLALNELDTKVFDSPNPGAAPRVYDDFITVPDAHLLFNGEFKRVGTNDLKIVGESGESFFVPDYFASEHRAHLMSPQGATLSPAVVEALAGPLAPGQHAQAGAQPAAGQPVIGRVDALSGSATVVRNGVTVSLNVGDNVRRGDVVQTSGDSSVAIVFADGTTFSLNANARMVLDNFVYAAGGAGNSALISLVQGTFSFVAGQVAKTGDLRVETPVATMGIRGTAVLVEISASDGQTRFSVMLEPDGTTGSFNLYNKTTGALIATVNNSQVGWTVTPAGPLQVVAQQVAKTPAELQQELGIVQQIFTIFNNNQQNPFVPPQDRGDNPNDANPQTAQGSGSGSTPDLIDDRPISLADAITNASNNPASAPTTILAPLPGLLQINPQTSSPPIAAVTVTPNQPPVAVPDPDGTPGGGDVIDNDSDPEGSIITVTSAQHVVPDESGEGYVPAGEPVAIDDDGETVEGSYGTLTLAADGTYTFTPNEAFDALPEGVTVVDTFQYTITDPFGATASAILTINLTGVNDAPVVSGTVTGEAVEDGESVTLDALENASDVDAGTTLSVVLAPNASLPPGVTFNSEAGTFTLDPSHEAYQSLAAGETITVTVNYVVSDGKVPTPASVSWTVTGTADGPVANDDTAEMHENQVLFVDVLANDDGGGTTGKTLTSIGSPTITGPEGVPLGTPAIVIEGNQIRITPGTAFDALAAGEEAIITIPYTMTTAGSTSSATATVIVTGTNDAPYFSVLPEGMEAIGTVGDASFEGVDALRLTSEGASQSAIEAFLGLAPGTLDALEQDTTEGAAIAFDLTLVAGETVSFSWNFVSDEYTPYNDYAFVSVASAFAQKLSDISTIGDSVNDGFDHSSGWQQFVYAAEAAGQYRFGIGVMNEGDTAFDSFLYISGFSGIGFRRSTTEDGAIETFDLLNGAFDPDTHDVLKATNIEATGTNHLGETVDVSGAVNVIGNEVSIDPTFFSSLSDGESITVVINYDVSDGHTTRHNSATLVIDGVTDNSAPTAKNDTVNTDEDSAPLVFNVVQNDVDANGDALQVINISALSDPSLGALTYNDDGTFTFAPAENAFGTATFTYQASDGALTSNAATVTVNVTPVNDPPEASHVDLGMVTEDGSVTITSAQLLAGVTDIDGPPATITAFSIQSGGGTLVKNNNGSWTYTPAANDDTAVTFAYTASDGEFSANSTASLDITPVNDEPEASHVDLGMVTEGGSVTITAAQLLDGVTDIDGPPATITALSIQSGGGTLVDNENGTWTYTPAANGDTAVTFAYMASDGSLSANSTASLEVNDAPVAVDVALTNALSNGGFEAPNDFAGWTVDPSTSGLDDGFSAFSDVYIEREEPIFEGDDAVAVLAFGGRVPDEGGTGYGPSITSHTFTGDAGDTIRFVYQLSAGEDLNSGDKGIVTGYIIDASGTVVQSFTNSANLGQSTGMVTVNYELEQSGEFQIKFVVGSIDSTFGRVVGAQLDLGFAGILQNGVSEDAPYIFDAGEFIADATDLNGDTLSVNSVTTSGTSALGAMVFINSDGSVTYDPTTSAQIQALNAGEELEDSFVFTIRDEHGAISNNATATLTVHGVNDAPTTQDIDVSAKENASAIAITLTGNDIDGHIDGFQLTSLNNLNGSLSLSSDFSTLLAQSDLPETLAAVNGSLTVYFRPHEEFDGLASFEYAAVDDSGAVDQSPATVSIAIAPVANINILSDSGYDMTGFLTMYSGKVSEITNTSPHGFEFASPLGPNQVIVSGANLSYETTGAIKSGTVTGFVVQPVEGEPLIESSNLEIDALVFSNGIALGASPDAQQALADAFHAHSYTVVGSEVSDWLVGGDQADRIIGQGGSDKLTGSGGIDVFEFAPGDGQDVIMDFSGDIIRLNGFNYDDVSDLTVVDNGEGFARILLGDGQWIDLNGVPHTTQFSNANFIFSGALLDG